MTNAYYNRTLNPLPTQRVGSNELKSEFQSVAGGFDAVADEVARAVKLPAGTSDQLINLSPAARANLVLAFDAAGNITAISYGRFRGDWATATAYVVSDYFRDPASKNVYAVTAAHTSGVLADDITAGRVQLAINVADVEAAKTAAQDAAATAVAQVTLATAQAGIATTKAGEAATSAATATTQAGVATTQAGNAANTFTAFDKRYLGAKASNPSLDNQGAALAVGALYYNTGVNEMRSWNGATWEASYLPASGYVTEAPNDGKSYTRKSLGWAEVSSKLLRSARTSNTMLAGSDAGKLIDITSGTFTQTFDAAATLGDGWYCYLGNSGTGDITLDPNGAELIDGLASYVMYPGEVRLIQSDGTELRTIVLNTFYKTFTSSGTFTKPPGYAAFEGLLWGGGASGYLGAGPGGGGGACAPFKYEKSALSATEAVVIGAGSTSNFSTGGTSSFKNTSAYGGYCSNSQSRGGGILSAATNAAAGEPQLPAGGTYEIYGGANTNAVSVVVYGGSACESQTAAGGNTIWGGAAGGGSGAGALRAGGVSKYGGSGGQSTGAVGTDGTAPGGGGGAGTTTRGNGARGELRIWGVI